MKRARGFSLLELLVATALFAVLALLAYGGLNQIVDQGSRLQARADRFAELQRGVDRLVSDLRAATTRGVRDGNRGRVPALLGTPQRLAFTRAGYGNRLEATRSQLERVAWQLDGDQLLREHDAALDRASSVAQARDAWLSGVESLRFSYFDDSGREFAQWPLVATDALPSAVRVELQLRDFGHIERLIELPHAARR